MSATVQALPLPALDTALLQQACASARQSSRPVIAELEALTGTDPRQLIQAVAALFGLPVVETAEMMAMQPAFDLLPLSRAMQRHCALLRTSEGRLIGVIADPFDTDLQVWLDAQAKTPLDYRLALQADI